jgi:hypothetical protein
MTRGAISGHCRHLPNGRLWNVGATMTAYSALMLAARHLAPLLSLFGNELIEVGGGARKRDAPKVCEVHLQPEISETRIDLLVELLDDLGGCEPPRLRWARYGLRTFRSVWASRTAQRVRSVPMTAGSVTAGKSRAMTDGAQIPTATSQKWKRA